MDDSQPNPTSAAAEEVTWQVAFFALVPLALGAMAQPIGRVMDMPLRHSFWLRSSPIICAADMLHFCIRYADRCIQDGRFLDQFKAELSDRFPNGLLDPDQKAVEKTAIVRWIMILLGVVPCQTVKLVAMKGVPVSKAVALAFFLAMVFGEAVNLSAIALLTKHDDPIQPSTPADQPVKLATLADRPYRKSRFASWILWMLPPLAEAIHFLVVQYIILCLWSISAAEFSSLAMLNTVFQLGTLARSLKIENGELNMFQNSGFGPIFVMLGCGHRVLFSYVNADPKSVFNKVVAVSFFICCTPIVLVWSSIEALEAISETTIGSRTGVPSDVVGQAMVVFFLVNVTACLLGYAFLFDGSGTVNPRWTGIFG